MDTLAPARTRFLASSAFGPFKGVISMLDWLSLELEARVLKHSLKTDDGALPIRSLEFLAAEHRGWYRFLCLHLKYYLI